MKKRITLTILGIISVLCQLGFGQEYRESENFIGVIEGGTPPFIMLRYDNYSEADISKAKQKLIDLRSAADIDPWEGRYSSFGELSDTKLTWNSSIGFLSYYIYTCAIELRSLNYGKVTNKPGTLTLHSSLSKPPRLATRGAATVELIKVKWGNRHYLVEADQIEMFAELAAGYYGSSMKKEEIVNGIPYAVHYSLWNSFWVKDQDYREQKVFGLPVFPNPFEKLVRKPIEGKIAAIGKYEKDKPTDEPIMRYSRQFVTLHIGSTVKLKPGMEFFVKELGERVKIVTVKNSTSIAILERWLDSETRKEICLKNGEEFPCRRPEIGMGAKTIPDEFLEN